MSCILFSPPPLFVLSNKKINKNNQTLKQKQTIIKNKSVFLGGLARVEFISGRPFFMTFFMNHDVTIHPSPEQGDEADEFVKKHSGSILTPPFDSERCLGEMKAHDFEVGYTQTHTRFVGVCVCLCLSACLFFVFCVFCFLYS